VWSMVSIRASVDPVGTEVVRKAGVALRRAIGGVAPAFTGRDQNG
jgi:hypothetical protein